jgi:hypothetical protein
MIDLTLVFLILMLVSFVVFSIASVAIFTFIRFRHRGREETSINSVLLQISVHRGNEIKIDAMEQLFSSLYSIKKGGWKQGYSTQPTVSFEILGKKEDIRFYIWTPKEFQDMIEKQIHGAYPDAEVIEVQEYNIFTEKGKVSYKAFQLGKENYYPLKTYRDLPTDPMASLTSALAKMGDNESAVIQVLITPYDSSWQKAGSGFISSTKKQESDPGKAKFSVPAKTLEAVENKVSKVGFETSVRVVVVADNESAAKAHLANIGSVFAQFAGDLNSLKTRTIRQKGAFIEDFIYRYQPMFHIMGNRRTILNSEELATIYHFPNKAITTPHIHWVYAKSAPVPQEIPTEGLYLGLSNYSGVKRRIHIRRIIKRNF